MSLSHNTNNDGSMKITTNILIIAPRAISVQSEPIISTEAIHPTPNVAAKKPSALTIIDGIDVERAIWIASFLAYPWLLYFLYLVVIRIA